MLAHLALNQLAVSGEPPRLPLASAEEEAVFTFHKSHNRNRTTWEKWGEGGGRRQILSWRENSSRCVEEKEEDIPISWHG